MVFSEVWEPAQEPAQLNAWGLGSDSGLESDGEFSGGALPKMRWPESLGITCLHWDLGKVEFP